MDDFTFPATAAAAEPVDLLCLHHRHHGRLPFPHFASSPLWFPAATPVVVCPTVGMEEQEPTPDAGRRAEGEGGGEDDDDDDEEVLLGAGASSGVDSDDKMDLLWENFNEELEALRRAGSCSKAAPACGLELPDTESEPAERGRGCAPMLRPSSRAGGTGHYRRARSWVLLMRIFRRLFVVEKTITAAASPQARPQ